ncbi:hypothetical protein DVP71_00400 [Yersinia enterocolitica]|nr:hypothetical protein [Yersinia enterocolitica]EKN5919880.1 hypothetical protein [Yersinia enterocolitica]
MFKGGVENTTVLYSLRKWDKIPESLTTSVRTEVNYLLGQSNDYWFFESFNWIYDVDLLKCMLASIEEKLGRNGFSEIIHCLSASFIINMHLTARASINIFVLKIYLLNILAHPMDKK